MFSLARLAIIAGILVTLLGSAGWWLHSHDNAVRALMQDSADKAIQSAEARAHEAVVTALEAQAALSALRATSLATLKETTHAAPTSTGCASSPAVRALLDGVRGSRADRPGASPGGPGVAPDVRR